MEVLNLVDQSVSNFSHQSLKELTASNGSIKEYEIEIPPQTEVSGIFTMNRPLQELIPCRMKDDAGFQTSFSKPAVYESSNIIGQSDDTLELAQRMSTLTTTDEKLNYIIAEVSGMKSLKSSLTSIEEQIKHCAINSQKVDDIVAKCNYFESRNLMLEHKVGILEKRL